MVKHLLSRFPGQFALSVSCTTRAPRGQEQDGREYYFVSREAFEQHIANGDFIEYEQVYEGLYYGTLRSEIERIQSAGMTAVFDIDVKGGLNLKRIFGDEAAAVFIAPPSVEELARRLHGRGDTSEEMIYYLEKLDINEEKVRLRNHIKYFRETMQGDGTGVGKKLGFIAQEMGREINTLGSKSNQSEMQIIVVKMKDILEQIKEQVLNVL